MFCFSDIPERAVKNILIYILCTNYFRSWCNIRMTWVLYYFGINIFKTRLFYFIWPMNIEELKQMSLRVFGNWLMYTLPTYNTFEIVLCHLYPEESWFCLAESQNVFLEQILKHVLNLQQSKVTLQFRS